MQMVVLEHLGQPLAEAGRAVGHIADPDRAHGAVTHGEDRDAGRLDKAHPGCFESEGAPRSQRLGSNRLFDLDWNYAVKSQVGQ
jgi:hypothetical protein